MRNKVVHNPLLCEMGGEFESQKEVSRGTFTSHLCTRISHLSVESSEYNEANTRLRKVFEELGFITREHSIETRQKTMATMNCIIKEY